MSKGAPSPTQSMEIEQEGRSETARGFRLQRLVLSIAAYCIASLSVVYFNWWLFTSGFKYPVFISWLQQVVGFGIFSFGSFIALYFQKLRVVFPAPLFHKSVMLGAMPLSVSFVLCIAAANLCLQKTQISTYQVARSLTLLFILLLSYLILRERQTVLVLMACVLMVTGFIINSLDPATLSFYGLLFGAVSSFFQALYNVLIKFTLPSVENNNQMLLYYNVLLSSVLFLPVVFVCEGVEPFVESVNVADHSMLVVWGGILVSGVLGTTLNMTQYLLINSTTPLTFNIIGLIKSLIQSLGGIVFLGDVVTIESVLGITLSTVGSAVYVKAKHDQTLAKAADTDGALVIHDHETNAPHDQADVVDVKFDLEDPPDKPAADKAATPSTIFNLTPNRP